MQGKTRTNIVDFLKDESKNLTIHIVKTSTNRYRAECFKNYKLVDEKSSRELKRCIKYAKEYLIHGEFIKKSYDYRGVKYYLNKRTGIYFSPKVSGIS